MAFPIIPIAIAGLVLVACTQMASKPDNLKDQTLSSLAGSEWAPSANSDQFVQFRSDTELSGFGGCNRFGGSYELNGQRLIIGPMMMTKKACFDTMKSEQAFVSALQNAHHIEATHLKLRVFDENDQVLLELIRKDWD